MINDYLQELLVSNAELKSQAEKLSNESTELEKQLTSIFKSRAYRSWQRFNRVKKIILVSPLISAKLKFKLVVDRLFEPVFFYLSYLYFHINQMIKLKINSTSILFASDSKSNPSVSILVTTFGSTDHLENLLNSMLRYAETTSFEIIIMNDNPQQEHRVKEWILSNTHLLKRLNISFYSNSINLGFTSSINLSADFSKGEYLFLLNDDTEVISFDWISSHISCLQNSSVALSGSLLVFDDQITVQHGGMHPFRKSDGRIYNYHYYKYFNINFSDVLIEKDVPMVTGAALCIKKKLFYQLGRLDWNYLGAGGFDDSDLCNKATKAGYLIRYCPSSKLIHFEGQTIKTMSKTHYLHYTHNHYYYENKWKNYIHKSYPIYV